MDIDGLGEKQVAALQARGLLTTAPDIYALRAEQLVELERYAEVSARNLIDAIDASRERPFARVLFALGIEEVGAVTGQNLARQFRSVDALLAATPEQIAETPGIGEKMAGIIAAQLAEPAMALQIERLRKAGLRFSEDGPPPGEGPLAGRTLVLTGTLPTLSREQATERILGAGGRVTSSVSRKTDYLVAGESAGTKLEKAERLGVPVVDEAGLLELLGAGLAGRGQGDRHPVLERVGLGVGDRVHQEGEGEAAVADPGERRDADQGPGLGRAAPGRRRPAHPVDQGARAPDHRQVREQGGPGRASAAGPPGPSARRRSTIWRGVVGRSARGRTRRRPRGDPEPRQPGAHDGRPGRRRSAGAEVRPEALEQHLGEVVVRRHVGHLDQRPQGGRGDGREDPRAAGVGPAPERPVTGTPGSAHRRRQLRGRVGAPRERAGPELAAVEGEGAELTGEVGVEPVAPAGSRAERIEERLVADHGAVDPEDAVASTGPRPGGRAGPAAGRRRRPEGRISTAPQVRGRRARSRPRPARRPAATDVWRLASGPKRASAVAVV